MSDKKRPSRGKGKAIYSLLLLIPNIISLINKVTLLLRHDASLAGKSVVLIITLAVMSACLLTSTWLGILAVIFFVCLVKLQLNWIIATVIVFLLNFLFLFAISIAINKAKYNLTFPATRAQLSRRRDY